MLRFFIRLLAVVIVASLPIPLHAQAPPAPPLPPAPSMPDIAKIVEHATEAASHAATWSARSWKESWQSKQGPETTERITKSFKVGPSGTLDIGNVSGDIIVNEGGTDTIVVDALKRARGGDAKAQMLKVQVVMTERSGRVEVRTEYERNTRNVSVDYTVTAPAGSSVYAHAVSGDIKVTSIKGEVRVDTVSGDVAAIGTPGATLVKTVSGDASVSGVSNGNELRATTVSGDVTVSGAKVRAIDADSISGTVHLSDVSCERATAKSISGDITFGGALSRGGRYEFKSQSGEIRVTLTGTPGFELDASSFSGNVRSDLPITLRAGEPIGGGHGPGKKVHGVYGDGSAQLVVTSFSGNVVIAKK